MPPEYFVTRKKMPPEKKISTCKHVIYQSYDIKYQKNVIFQICSQNHNIQYHKVKITNFILKGYSQSVNFGQALANITLN